MRGVDFLVEIDFFEKMLSSVALLVVFTLLLVLVVCCWVLPLLVFVDFGAFLSSEGEVE